MPGKIRFILVNEKAVIFSFRYSGLNFHSCVFPFRLCICRCIRGKVGGEEKAAKKKNMYLIFLKLKYQLNYFHSPFNSNYIIKYSEFLVKDHETP